MTRTIAFVEILIRIVLLAIVAVVAIPFAWIIIKLCFYFVAFVFAIVFGG